MFVKWKHIGKVITIIIILFMLTLSQITSNVVLATSESTEGQSVQTYDAYSNQEDSKNPLDVIGSIFAWLIRLIPVSIAQAIGKILSTIGAAITGENLVEGLTLDKILFNEVELTSIDFFSTDNGNSLSNLKENVSIWYVAIRNLAAVALAIILVYVGIRMAISSVAEDKAKYKKMLFNWITSLAILFLLHYIMVAIIGVNNSIVDIISEGRDEKASQKYVNTMNQFALKSYDINVGLFDGIGYAFIYLLLSLMTFIFLLTYIKRMITIAFLIIIAPIITITYSIDKMGDGKSQALNTWFKEFVYNVLIQCFHCIIYLALVQTSFNMLTVSSSTNNPFDGAGETVLAFLMVVFMYQAEDIVKNIFGFKASSLPQTIGQAAVVATAVGAMGKAGKSASSKGGGGGGSKKNPKQQTNPNQDGNQGGGNQRSGNQRSGNQGGGNQGGGNQGGGNQGGGNQGGGNQGGGDQGGGNQDGGNQGNKKSKAKEKMKKALKAGIRTSIKASGVMVGAVAGASTGNLNAAISGAMAIGGATSGLVDSHNIKSKQRRIAKAYNDFEQEHSELDAKSKVEYSRMLLDGEIEAKTDAEREYVEAMRDLNNVYERNGDSSDDAGDKIEKVIKRIQDGDISETSAPIRFYNSTKETGKKLANKIKQARNRNNAT